MPSDIVSVVVSTGVGVSVLAGILSGVCYIIAHGVQRKRNKHRRNSLSCPVCGRELQRRPSVDSALSGSGVGRWAACSRCQRRACKGRCAQFRAGEGWVCGECSRPPESTGNARAGGWIRDLMETLVAPPPIVPQDEIGERMDAGEDDEKRRKDREDVRDFIERLVNVLLGENVDDASVNRLYNDEKYLPVTGQSPCTAHAALKQIIERLLREAINLPSLNRDSQSLPPNETDRTYEDLLATAIINKVVSNSQHTRPGSSAASLSSRTSTPSRRRRVKEYFFGEETLEDKWKTTDLDTSSVSSLEEWIHSDSSFGSRKYVDRVTLTIKQDIEEVAQSESENEDDSEYFRTNSSLLSEEEPNWFLQKRQFQGTHSPVPVPMLVPNPTTEAKVLIGDKEVDETSDLSDVGSDYGEAESVPGRTSLLIESKTVIGGKNLLVDGDSDDESSGDSGVKEVDGSASGQHTPNRHDTAKTDITVDDDNVEDASIMSVYSNTEKVAEYTERYGSLPRTIVKSPVPTPPTRVSLQKSKQQEEVAQQNGTDQTDSIKENGVQNNEEDLNKDIEIFSGRYSKREKEKWKHAVEMKNNPYSPENIEKRMKQSSSTISSLFGPDYYAKLAATPRGGRGDSPEVNEPAWTPIKERETEEQEKSMIIEDVFESSTDPGTPTPNASLKSVSLLSPEPKTELEMTSDSDLSVVNCYNIAKSEVSVTPKVRNGTIDNASASESEIEVIKKDMPKPRERPKYLKLNSAAPSRNLRSPLELTSLKRHKSETDLLSEDSFDAPPRILGQKKDNTLISRIYQDPHVRNFALSSREHLPVETLNYSRYNGNQVGYNSDDGFPNSTRRKLFSYDDDLLRSNVVRTTNDQFRRSRSHKLGMSPSSEEGKSLRQRQHIYSSSEDLLETEKRERRPSVKKDNTIISRIYQDPNVRNFAMTNSERQELGKKSYSSEEDVFSPGTPKLSSTRSEDALNGILSRNEDSRMRASFVHTPDSDIDELAKKQIVHNILDQISRSRDASQERGPKDGYVTDEEINVSVKDLRKLFESNEGTGKVISSLTARSLSKQIREDLKLK